MMVGWRIMYLLVTDSKASIVQVRIHGLVRNPMEHLAAMHMNVQTTNAGSILVKPTLIVQTWNADRATAPGTVLEAL
jgi:hypothetical protein